MAYVLPIRKKEDIFKIREYFLDKKQYRNHVLFILGLNSLLRISDLLSLKINDVYDFQKKCVRSYLDIKEKKTNKHNLIIINNETKEAITLYLNSIANQYIYPERYLFTSTRSQKNKAVSSTQTYRILNEVKYKLGLDVPRIGNHTLRKTKVYHYLKHGANNKLLHVGVFQLIIVMKVLNHNDIISTLAYAGIMQDEIDDLHLWSLFDS